MAFCLLEKLFTLYNFFPVSIWTNHWLKTIVKEQTEDKYKNNYVSFQERIKYSHWLRLYDQ